MHPDNRLRLECLGLGRFLFPIVVTFYLYGEMPEMHDPWDLYKATIKWFWFQLPVSAAWEVLMDIHKHTKKA